jgi:manganese transport protein
MKSFASARRTRIAGWVSVGIILVLNVVLLGQIALGQ